MAAIAAPTAAAIPKAIVNGWRSEASSVAERSMTTACRRSGWVA